MSATFDISDTNLAFSDRKVGKLVVAGARSQVAVANRAGIPLHVTGLTQQFLTESGSVFAAGSAPERSQIAPGSSYTGTIDVKFDGGNSELEACFAPLARRTHDCSIRVQTTMTIEGRHACSQTAVTHVENIRFESRHLIDSYTIKLWRDE